MNFVNYKTSLFTGLSDNKEVLISAENTLIINGINICNKTNENIGINLELVRLGLKEQRNFIVNNKLITGNESLNLMFPGGIFLQLEDLDSLLCFSNAYDQVFDCTICYQELVEKINEVEFFYN